MAQFQRPGQQPAYSDPQWLAQQQATHAAQTQQLLSSHASSRNQRMAQYQRQIAEYNSVLPGYNAAVGQYNAAAAQHAAAMAAAAPRAQADVQNSGYGQRFALGRALAALLARSGSLKSLALAGAGDVRFGPVLAMPLHAGLSLAQSVTALDVSGNHVGDSLARSPPAAPHLVQAQRSSSGPLRPEAAPNVAGGAPRPASSQTACGARPGAGPGAGRGAAQEPDAHVAALGRQRHHGGGLEGAARRAVRQQEAARMPAAGGGHQRCAFPARAAVLAEPAARAGCSPGPGQCARPAPAPPIPDPDSRDPPSQDRAPGRSVSLPAPPPADTRPRLAKAAVQARARARARIRRAQAEARGWPLAPGHIAPMPRHASPCRPR